MMFLYAAAFASAVDEPIVLSAAVDRAWADVRDLDGERCVALLERMYVDLEGLEPAGVDAADVAAKSQAMVRQVFDARLLLHEHLRSLAAAEALTPECLRSMRRVDIAGRYLVDYLWGAMPPTDPWLVNPAFTFAGPDDLRSGDLLVARGDALSSAGIAHMGRIDSQFSHNALIWVDPRSGRKHTVEAYLELGAHTQPLEKFLDAGFDRLVVLRHKDADLAERAATAAYERLKRRPRIDYDSDFDQEDHSALFCSEVASWAFGTLLERDSGMPMPAALSAFDHENNGAMFRAMGITRGVTSAPADMLFDPQFDWVAEWRDVGALYDLRRQDAVVEAVFQWFEDLDYQLQVHPRHRATVKIGRFLRRVPLIGGALKHKIHPRGDPDFLVGSLALFEAALAAEELFQERTDRLDPLVSFQTLRDEMEAVRLEDLAHYETSVKSARFHGVLVPAPATPASP